MVRLPHRLGGLLAGTLWFIIFGIVFTLMGLAASWVKRLPLTTSLLYLLVGFALGPHVLGFFHLSPVRDSAVLHRATELVVIVSLFAAGLKLRVAWDDPVWRLAFRLAFGSMIVTVALVACAGVWLLGLSPGAAILLGGILAPTDPVLASDVQVRHPHDEDRLRFGLTGEAGLNDGTAFPVVMLGLGLLGHHDIGERGLRWLLFDVLWAIPGGLLIGAALGTAVAHVVISFRRRRKETLMFDDFLALGLIALSYGLAVYLKAYGFLAVFAAGLALRRAERTLTGREPPSKVKELAALGGQDEVVAASPEKVPAYTAQAILFFNEQLERLGEVAMVILLGGMVRFRQEDASTWLLVPLLFLLIRPVSVLLGLIGSSMPASHSGFVAWFGIRGIGSLYYLMYSIEQGIDPQLARQLGAITVTAVAASIVVHGISVTPLMSLHGRRNERHAKSVT